MAVERYHNIAHAPDEPSVSNVTVGPSNLVVAGKGFTSGRHLNHHPLFAVWHRRFGTTVTTLQNRPSSQFTILCSIPSPFGFGCPRSDGRSLAHLTLIGHSGRRGVVRGSRRHFFLVDQPTKQQIPAKRGSQRNSESRREKGANPHVSNSSLFFF